MCSLHTCLAYIKSNKQVFEEQRQHSYETRNDDYFQFPMHFRSLKILKHTTTKLY